LTLRKLLRSSREAISRVSRKGLTWLRCRYAVTSGNLGLATPARRPAFGYVVTSGRLGLATPRLAAARSAPLDDSGSSRGAGRSPRAPQPAKSVRDVPRSAGRGPAPLRPNRDVRRRSVRDRARQGRG
jgi:hypothetical protein